MTNRHLLVAGRDPRAFKAVVDAAEPLHNGPERTGFVNRVVTRFLGVRDDSGIGM